MKKCRIVKYIQNKILKFLQLLSFIIVEYQNNMLKLLKTKTVCVMKYLHFLKKIQ